MAVMFGFRVASTETVCCVVMMVVRRCGRSVVGGGRRVVVVRWAGCVVPVDDGLLFTVVVGVVLVVDEDGNVGRLA